MPSIQWPSLLRQISVRKYVEKRSAAVEEAAGHDDKPSIVMHDRDTKFTREFIATLKARGVRTNAPPKASPNLNGRCERAIQTIKYECLRQFIVFGKPPDEIDTVKRNQIEVKSYVGGLVKSFERKAA